MLQIVRSDLRKTIDYFKWLDESNGLGEIDGLINSILDVSPKLLAVAESRKRSRDDEDNSGLRLDERAYKYQRDDKYKSLTEMATSVKPAAAAAA